MRYKILLTFSLLMFLFASCTKEVVNDCVVRTTFKCSFEFNNDNSDQFAKLVNKVDLYIFDGSGLLVKHISQTQDYLPELYSVAVNLKYGVYTAVMYGTTNGKNEVSVGVKQGDLTTLLSAMKEGESRMSDMRLMLNSVNGQTNKDLGVILHGIVPQITVTSESDEKTYIVPFTRITNQVEMSISGLENLIADTKSKSSETRAESDIAVRIEGNNKAYLYDNTLDMELGRVNHAPYWQSYTNGVLNAKLSVLKLFKEQPMTLKIYNGSDVIRELNLTDEIMKSPKYNTNEDLDREDTFVVNVTVDTAGDFTIVVNGWTTTTSSEIIG